VQPDQRIFAHFKVESVKLISEKKKFDGSTLRQAECIIGDSKGCLKMNARDTQLDIVKEGETITLMNAHVKFVNGFIRIEIDKWAIVKPAAQGDTIEQVAPQPNFSEVEYEMVRLDEHGKESED